MDGILATPPDGLRTSGPRPNASPGLPVSPSVVYYGRNPLPRP